LIRMPMVRFIGGSPEIDDRGKGPFSPNTEAGATRARSIDDANAPLGKDILDLQ
jgi:hypothetical protein